MSQIKNPISFDEFLNRHTVNEHTKMSDVYKQYNDYLKLITRQNECYIKTKHMNQKYVLGMYICQDCGADV